MWCKKVRVKDVWQNSYIISRTTKLCFDKKNNNNCQLSVWEKTINSKCFWLSQWQDDLYINKYNNSFLITEGSSLIMIAPYLLSSPKVQGGADTGLSF